MYNKAAGDRSSSFVDFAAAGGTGDHVGKFDMWNMVEGEEKDAPDEKKSTHFEIPSIQMDQMLNNEIIADYKFSSDGKEGGITRGSRAGVERINRVFAMKVDTQGFEPKVFPGMKYAIENHKIDYILTEFWPRGIDLINESPVPCKDAVSYLHMLSQAGYTLHATPVIAHPKISKEAFQYTKNWKKNKRQFDDVEKDCAWMYNIEKEVPLSGYKMGYWTDVVAVSPEAPLSKTRTTIFSKLVGKSLSVDTISAQEAINERDSGRIFKCVH